MKSIATDSYQFTSFSSCLGWMALVWGPAGVRKLTLGHAEPQLAIASLAEPDYQLTERPDKLVQDLIKRLQAFTTGREDSFLDVKLDDHDDTEFQKSVRAACRNIPRGSTLTYAELAAQAGSPRAARAVGNVMATNRVPVIVPCHRVVAANSLGGYSAPRGLELKVTLLELEGAV